MVPSGYHDFFLAEAGASAALIGLLFVAVSVASDRVVGKGAEIVEQARASSALTALIIPLALSLVALLPGARLGIPAVIVSFAGLLFVAATLRRYLSVDKSNRENPRGLVGLFGFSVVVALIFAYGIVGIVNPGSPAVVLAIAPATIACVLLGVDRAWALIGGHGRGRGTALIDLVRGEDPGSR
jgi:hypothetical protein